MSARGRDSMTGPPREDVAAAPQQEEETRVSCVEAPQACDGGGGVIEWHRFLRRVEPYAYLSGGELVLD